MTDRFVFNHNHRTLINIDHIRSIHLDAPCYERTDWWVVANLTYGTEILFKGTEDECLEYLEEFAI